MLVTSLVPHSISCPNIISHVKFYLIVLKKSLAVSQFAQNFLIALKTCFRISSSGAACTIFLVIFLFFTLMLDYLCFTSFVFLFLGLFPWFGGTYPLDFLGSSEVLPWQLRWLKICLQCRRPEFNPWVRKLPCRREWQPTPVFLPGKSHEQRSLVGYSPWGYKELDMTEQLTKYISKLLYLLATALV